MTTIESFDSRADGQRRRITLARDRIVIDRALQGVEMRVALDPLQYQGVLLDTLVAEATDVLWRISLRHTDPDLTVTLAFTDREAEALDLQNKWSRYFSLPRCVETADGGVELQTTRGPPSPRRRGRATLRRRNRFLTRRKVGTPALGEPLDGRAVNGES